MNLWHLQVFREVMLTGAVTQAAQNLGRTQPAISAALSNLEKSIGYALFERRNARLYPVPEAQYLLGEAEEILGRMGALEQSMKEGTGLDTSQIRIGCMPIFAEFFMPNLITRFTEVYPQATFHMVAPSSLAVYERIAGQQFDVGLAELGWESDLVTAERAEVDCICAFPADHPLAGRDFVTPYDLDDLPCSTLLPEHFIPRRLREIFADAGVRLNVRYELQNAAAQYPVVAEGAAYGVFSPLSGWIFRKTYPDPGAVVFVPLRPSVIYPFAILTPRHRPLSRLARQFVEALQGELNKVLLEIGETPCFGEGRGPLDVERPE